MGKRVKLLITAGIALGVLALLALHLLQDRLARHLLESAIFDITGFGVTVDAIDSALLARRVAITGLHLYNPDGFPVRDALDIDRIEVEYFWSTLLRGRPWLRRVEVDVDRITIVQPERGPANLDLLNRRIEEWQGAATLDGAAGLDARWMPVAWVGRPRQTSMALPGADELWIQAMSLRIASVSMIDYRLGGPDPMRVSQEVNIAGDYTDVRDLDVIAERIAIEFAVTEIADALGLSPGDLPPAFEVELEKFIQDLSAPPSTDQAPGVPVSDPEDQFMDIIDGVRR